MSHTALPPPIWLRRLRLAGIVVPVAAIVIFHTAQMVRDGGADLVIGILSVIAVMVFGFTMFALLGRGYRVIEHQNRELAGTNAILTSVARHDPQPVILDQVVQHLVELLGANDARIDIASGRPFSTSTHGEPSTVPSASVVSSAPVMLRDAKIGDIHVYRDKELHEHERRLLETAADMVSLTVAQAGVLENERHLARVDELDRIARELHDSLAQVLGTLHLRLRAIPEPIGEHTEEVRAEIDALGDLCHAAYQDVREAITGLRSLTRADESFTQALSTYASHYARLGGPETGLYLNGLEPELDPATRLHLLRMIQEALTNTRKHAAAQRVRIVLDDVAGGQNVLIEDDGRGFDAGTKGCEHAGYGLQTMRERSTLIGAELDVHSEPGAGTRVSIRLPHSTEKLRQMERTA